MTSSRRLGLALVLALAAPLHAAEDRAATLVLRGGVVHTLDDARPLAQAVAVRGNRIVAVGSDEDVAPLVGAGTKVIDLKGQTLIPGFQESHAHLLSMGRQHVELDLSDTESWDDVVSRVAAAVARRAPGEWIVGRGWHQERWGDRAALKARGFPRHHELSRISPNTPVLLRRADGHAAIVNGRAMEIAGLRRGVKSPSGGEVLEDESGEPSGVLVDNAMDLVTPPAASREQRKKFIDLAVQECLEKGITSFVDAGVTPEDIDLYEEHLRGGIGVRLYVMVAGLDGMRQLGAPRLGLADGFLDVRAVKLYADGALGSRGAALLEPYLDDPGNRGLLLTTPETLLEASRFALDHGFQACTHAIGDRANRIVLDQYEKAFAERPGIKDPRFRIEHAQVIDAADIPRFGKLGVIASIQGIHATSDRPWAENRIGLDRVREGAYAWRKLIGSGARLVNGTDAPVEDASPLRNFYASITRQDVKGEPRDGWDPDQRLTREQALRSYTLDAAFATFAEKDKGSVQVGKLADFTVLSRDIMKISPDDILETQVVLTVVDGKIWYHRPAGGSTGSGHSFESF